MKTVVFITNILASVYTSPLDRVGFIQDARAVSVFYVPGTLGVILSDTKPAYLYERDGMVWVSDSPISACGPLVAQWVPAKVAA